MLTNEWLDNKESVKSDDNYIFVTYALGTSGSWYINSTAGAAGANGGTIIVAPTTIPLVNDVPDSGIGSGSANSP